MTYQDLNSNQRGNVDKSSATSGEPMAETRQKTEKLRENAGQLVDDMRDAASTAVSEGSAHMRSAATDAAGAFKDAVESNKTAGADAVVNLARSAKEAADEMQDQSPRIASVVRSTAEGVEKLSTDIRDRNVGELLASVTDFAKRQPAAFFGCGMLAGIVVSRLMRSSDR